MEDWIVIPDVHGRDFWRSAVRGREEEKIIFLGDYVDPYSWEGITPHVAFLELQDIIEFKKAHPDNVVLLLGNHDLGYLDREICDSLVLDILELRFIRRYSILLLLEIRTDDLYIRVIDIRIYHSIHLLYR